MIFGNLQDKFVTELKSLLDKNKNNISLIYFSKGLKLQVLKNIKGNNIKELIKLLILAKNHTPLELPGNSIAYVINGKQIKVKFTFNNNDKILKCKIDRSDITVNLQELGDYLKALGDIKNVSSLKKELNNIIKNLKTI